MKKIYLLALVTFCLIVAFIVGVMYGHKTGLDRALSSSKNMDIKVVLGEYKIFRDIAVNISSKNYENALCISELLASSKMDELRACLNDSSCSGHMADASKIAPELFDKKLIKFEYKDQSNGVRLCDKEQKIHVYPMPR